MKTQQEVQKKPKVWAYLATPLMSTVAMLGASLVSIYLLHLDGEMSPVPVFVFFAVVNLVCMLLFAVLPVKRKGIARHAAMFVVGSTILFLAGILGKQNFQLEGFFFFALSGAFGGVIIHYVVGKILGPMLTGRSWCSWGCWTVMLLDLLPYKQSQGWVKGKSVYRYVHFGLVLGLVLVLMLGFKYTLHGENDAAKAMVWFLVGNGLYYAAAIGLAIALKDNRAFCKYLCPVTVFLKAGTMISLLRIKGDKATCTRCGDCTRSCPMNIEISEYVHQGERVKSTECIMCMKCISVCSTASLSSSISMDLATTDKVKRC